MDFLLSKRLRLTFFFSLLFFWVFGTSVLQAQDKKTRLYDLYDLAEEYEDSLRSIGGDTTFSTFSIEDRNKQYTFGESMLGKINNIDRDALEHGDQISYDLFKREVRREIRDHKFGDYLLPINHEGGFHTRIVGYANSIDPDSLKEYENYLSRLRSVPEYFEANIHLMRKGLAEGHTLPKKVLSEDYKEMITSQIVKNPVDSDFYNPLVLLTRP